MPLGEFLRRKATEAAKKTLYGVKKAPNAVRVAREKMAREIKTTKTCHAEISNPYTNRAAETRPAVVKGRQIRKIIKLAKASVSISGCTENCPYSSTHFGEADYSSTAGQIAKQKALKELGIHCAYPNNARWKR